MRALILLAALAACGDKEPLETATPVEDSDDVEPQGCGVVELDVQGPEAPKVGDSWTVWLRCDGATMLGATVLRFDPPSIATLDDNVATFVEAGETTMTMQVGVYRETLTFTVAP
ncbi:MAG: hypothetical protein IPI35_15000 [Deltaproteobacteria bacterium]|nr:hypothetical protein [Deltaproteobacteria bacterium]